MAFAASLVLDATPVLAGAFMMPEGQGQIVAGVGYIEAARRFDRAGRSVPTPVQRETEAAAYAEYGLREWLTIVAAPTYARLSGSAFDPAYTGSNESAVGARVRLGGDGARVLSLQVLAEPPLGVGRGEARLGGPRTAAVDIRLQYGESFRLFGCPAYVDVDPGARLRGGGFATQMRVDASLGARPWPTTLVILQAFGSLNGRALVEPSAAYLKMEVSLVQDLAPGWSMQLGAIRTIAGRNAAREFGPLAAMWHRF